MQVSNLKIQSVLVTGPVAASHRAKVIAEPSSAKQIGSSPFFLGAVKSCQVYTARNIPLSPCRVEGEKAVEIALEFEFWFDRGIEKRPRRVVILIHAVAKLLHLIVFRNFKGLITLRAPNSFVRQSPRFWQTRRCLAVSLKYSGGRAEVFPQATTRSFRALALRRGSLCHR